MELSDVDVPGWWLGLGLPGLIDVHTHFMPAPVMNAVWRYFDDAETNYGAPWPVQYRLPEDERVAILERLGVRRFTALVYPHKPDMAQWLSQWARDFAAATPGCAVSGTFFPEPSAAAYVREALDAGTTVFKAHVQVGGYDPRDDLLDPVWGLLAEAGAPVIVHCGSGPLAGRFTGPAPFAEVLSRHPRLTAVIAHAGAPEFAEHLELARTYPNVHLDTTMVATPYMDRFAPFDRALIPQFGDLQDRVVLGTDFPNIPCPYAVQLQALQEWDLGEAWLRDVCWHNGLRLLGG